ncbi:hypothetical protein PRK78_006361 [Emydomyces testavorans]|uniref:Uncharacterized protein n=1 Tax=Emydomyces testavorans TaxID=2070801 RepID=A0AAF0DLY5_9EURO|nr:hypothetical protein PRK78_006361 [Emydomyces testavorans]
MIQREKKDSSFEGPVLSPRPSFTFAKSIIANYLTGISFESAFMNRGPGIFSGALAFVAGFPRGIAINGTHRNNAFHSEMETVVATSDDAQSYSSFTSTTASDTSCSSDLSTPSTLVDDRSAASSFSFTSAHHSSPKTAPCDFQSSIREPTQDIVDIDPFNDSRASHEDSDGGFSDIEDVEGSETESVGCADGRDDDMEFKDSEDGETRIGDEDMEEEDISMEQQLSFICFERSVHFSSSGDEIIPRSGTAEPLPDAIPEMTCHERMILVDQLKARQIGNWENGGDYDPEEHSRDSLALDKELLFAYINGLRTLNHNCCKAALRSRTLHAKQDGISRLDARTEKDMNEYLERIADLLRGIFPNLFTEDEYTRILVQAKSAISFDEHGQLIYEPRSVDFQHMIRGLLAERLAYDDMFLEDEVLEWFAGNLIAPLGRQAFSRQREGIA